MEVRRHHHQTNITPEMENILLGGPSTSSDRGQHTNLTPEMEGMLLRCPSTSTDGDDAVNFFEELPHYNHADGSGPSGSQSNILKKLTDLEELYSEAVSNIPSSKTRGLFEKKYRFWKEDKGIY